MDESDFPIRVGDCDYRQAHQPAQEKKDADERGCANGKTGEYLSLVLRNEQKAVSGQQQDACRDGEKGIERAAIHLDWRIAQIGLTGYSVDRNINKL